MAIKKTIVIIGASGEMGSAIAKTLVNSNYRLLLTSRDKSKVGKLSAYLKRNNPTAEVAVIECEKEACWEADIILLAVPYRVEKEVAEKIREVATQKVVIDVSNPLNESFDHLIIGRDISAAEELQKALPNSKVVKAFSTIFATDFSRPIEESKQIKTFIAGDDEEALQTVSELTTAMGFEPVLCGSLSHARKIEQMMLQLIELKTEENFNDIISGNMHRHAPITFKSTLKYN